MLRFLFVQSGTGTTSCFATASPCEHVNLHVPNRNAVASAGILPPHVDVPVYIGVSEVISP